MSILSHVDKKGICNLTIYPKRLVKHLSIKRRPIFDLRYSNIKTSERRKTSPAFTIVELLIVIAIIGILAAITIVSYIGITSRTTASVLQSNLTTASQQLKLYQTLYSSYPTALDANNCPTTPNIDNTYCLKPSSGTTFQYAANNNTNIQTFSLTATKGTLIYSLSQNSTAAAGGLNLLTGDTSIERTSSNEFVQYADLAPIFDGYGIRQYTISFDIKSANTSVQNTIDVYMQNGSGARYNFSVGVPVTTLYSRQSITITPTLVNAGLAQSILAFYGTYGTGNIASVKNVKVEIGSTATNWTLAP